MGNEMTRQEQECPMNPIERRRDTRLRMDRPVKVQCEMTGRYLSATTRNISATGMLMEINHASLLVQGQRLRVGIAWNDHAALLPSSHMMQAVVVRSLGIDGRQHVAVHFDARQELELAATA